MKNPWLAKNPALSLWLSAFHTSANAARGPVALAWQRQMHAMTVQSVDQMMRLWSGAALVAKPQRAIKAPRRRK